MLEIIDHKTLGLVEDTVNTRSRYITDSETTDYILKYFGLLNTKVDFFEVSEGVGINRICTSVEEFFHTRLAPSLNVLISHRPTMRLADGLGVGVYIQAKCRNSFFNIVTNPYVTIGEFVIDSEIDDEYLKYVKDMIKESRNTKNKRIAFTPNCKMTILYNSRQDHDRVIRMLG